MVLSVECPVAPHACELGERHGDPEPFLEPWKLRRVDAHGIGSCPDTSLDWGQAKDQVWAAISQEPGALASPRILSRDHERARALPDP